MILGFKDQFVPFVEDGSKTHTIRAGERWKAGMRADLFARPRQKNMRLIFRAMVTKVEKIEIRTALPLGPWITINGEPLNEDEANLFAWRDGFRHYFNGHPSEGLGYGGCFAIMMDFWRWQLPFRGQIIHWDFAQRYIPCGDCGRSHPLGPCMVRSDWRLPRPSEMKRVLCAR